MNANARQDIKKDQILETAYQRFLKYGYSKTTMSDIASDLSLSKALLYYYFPDKSQLYIDVMRRLSNKYHNTLQAQINNFDNLKSAVVFQVDCQHNFLANHYNFFDFFKLNEQNLPAGIWEIVGEIRKAETLLLSSVIKTEAEKGVIALADKPESVAELLLDALNGVRVYTSSNKKMLFPRQEDLDEIHSKRLLLIDIFIRGLMN